MDNPTTRITLSNGLLVLLKEIHTAPLISQWVWYRVGSRNERPGKTGLSHWVEHMQFKGTPAFPAGVLDKAIARSGGIWNAYTNLDWTTYFETLPADKIDLAMQLEADRMTNSSFNPEDVEAERGVIMTERQGDDDEPSLRLAEAVQLQAFQVHSYRHEIIGELSDLEAIQRDDLYEHYRTHYTPNNAAMSFAGDFETEAMFKRVAEYYEGIPASPLPSVTVYPEPEQLEERHVQIDGPGETTYIQVSYHAPGAAHDDFLPLAVLDSLLSGPSDISLLGGGLSNKTSRLYRALVETELSVSVYGGLQATIDPYLHTIALILRPESSVEALIESLDHVIYEAQARPPSEEELARAVKQARALFAYSSESITHQAAWLGFTEMFADQSWLERYLDRLARVTPEQVQRVAQDYLRPQNRVLGIYSPNGGSK